MIEQKYIELIHKDIDKTISADEKVLLTNYLKSNPEAFTLHQELLETEELLDKLPSNDPSISLKQRILNSIDFNRYAHREQNPIVSYISTIFAGPQKKLAASFAFGMVVGIIIISIVFYASYYNSPTDLNNVFGTIGLSESEVFESVPVNSMDIAGKIEISKVANHYGIYVNLQSSKLYTMQMEFDQANLKVDNLSLDKLNNIQIEKGSGFIKLIESDNSPYSLLFSIKELHPNKIVLKILRDDKNLFQHEIPLSIN
jgi:hypothetical protein